MTNKKYILKPGRHQFAPGSHAAHNNESLSDEEAEWYLEKYPHIASLFEKNENVETLENGKVETLEDEKSGISEDKSANLKQQSHKKNNDLTEE